jgi:hypothetical protein
MQLRIQQSVKTISLLLIALQIPTALGDESADDWQNRRLMQPSSEEISWERAGNIMIYDGLTDRQVAGAMDGQFQRIESMMFTRIIVTDHRGTPAEDPVTGELITENDGCD